METNGLVRSVYGAHADNEIFGRLVRHPKLLEAAKQILQSEVYVHQFKINAKQAMGGDVWEWHQDFIFWNKEDGLPEPKVVNMTIFLDDVTEFNGPLMLIPGSHTTGTIDIEAGNKAGKSDGSPEWASNVSADLKYSLKRDVLSKFVSKNGIDAPKGISGSLLLFDANIIHGSTPNMSPFDRTVIIVTYNSTGNLPRPVKALRPEFLASRDYRALEPLADNCLIAR
jgi:ectoine hydroxylase